MLHHGVEGVVSRRRLELEAISLAMHGSWEEAVEVNCRILESFPTDVDTRNRLGRALMEMGNHAEAREAYSRALDLDPCNRIARKNFNRLSMLGESLVRSGGRSVPPQLFVGEVGKVGVVELENLTPQRVLAKMVTGDEVFLKRKEGAMVVEDSEGEYLGEVEKAHGLRLGRLTKGGNTYTAAIVGLGDGMMKVIVKETYQHPSQEGRMSFPVRGGVSFRAYVKESLLRPEMSEEPEKNDYRGAEGDDEEEEENEVLPQGFSYVGGAVTDDEEV